MRRLAILFALSACTGATTTEDPAPTASSLDVVALSYPVSWITRQLVGTSGQVTVMVPAGEDPPHWRPRPEAVAALAEADLIVANGAGYEPWIATASLPRDRLVQTAKGLDLIEREGETHSHGEAGTHHHGETDPHLWLDPLLHLSQAQAVHRRLVGLRPDLREALDARLQTLREGILHTHEVLQGQLAGLDQLAMVANHPSYDYLARRYGFGVQTFDVAPDTAPDEATVGQVTAWFTAHTEDQTRAPVMIWEAEPTDAVRAALPEGLRHVVVDPVEQPVGDAYVWDERLQASAGALHALVADPAGK